MPGEIAIAVVGAHMSGMPLNHELTERGARSLQATRTAVHYRLYALSGGPPFRPGLLRAAAGAAIDLEVWALPAAGFGDFVASIPAPLSIGKLTLEDSSEVSGFLVESLATEDARDVTDFGGWRAYCARDTGPDEA